MRRLPRSTNAMLALVSILLACGDRVDGSIPDAFSGSGGADGASLSDASLGSDAGAVARDDAGFSDASVSDAASSGGPIDGRWRYVKALCDTKPMPESANYTGPDSTFVFSCQGPAGTYAWTYKACTTTWPLSLSYPAGDRVVIGPAAAMSCDPLACWPCKAMSRLMSQPYKYTLSSTTLIFTSEDLEDPQCRAAGLAGPVITVFERV